jgi:hypothetical protein
MTNLRSSWKVAISVAALLVAVQIAVSLSVRTKRVHNYLSTHLESAFGRPVRVRHFNLEIFPSPRIYASDVTVGEDPAFGYEYFLRAEHLTAGLRWSGFIRGHFQFGTLTLSQPSLTLVRNSEGRWNLEDWLPPAKKNASAGDRVYGPSRAPMIANRLERIEFEDGRIDFKRADVKQPFALLVVSGSVEQISPGRWQLQMEAQPWRSGITLQSAGTVRVHGDIAGTSARLQPASLSIRWDKVSLADLFRLFRGQDYGVRGTFALEGTARSGAPSAVSANQVPAAVPFIAGDWSYTLKVSAAQIHRWDLTERSDNPAVTANIKGRWNVALGTFTAENLSLASPASNFQGTAHFASAADPFMQIKFESAGLQAADLLAWYRAFHPDVAEGITADQFFTGTLALQGWPLKFQQFNFSSSAGTLRVRGLDDALRVAPAHATLEGDRLVVDPLRVSLISEPLPIPPLSLTGTPPRHRAAGESEGQANLALTYDFPMNNSTATIQGRVDKAQAVLKIAAAFGHTLNHGWDLTGPARADLHREWSSDFDSAWNGTVEVSGAQLAAAGLNQPVQLQQARLEWHNGKRTAQIARAEGFGATWTGTAAEDGPGGPDQQGVWNVHMHADHLDATELDRWVGPRARPGWLQRLLPSLLGVSTASSGPASELLRRLNVSGEVQVDAFTIEKINLQQLHLQGSLQNLQLHVSEGRAQWAGGSIRATMLATFLPRPFYDMRAELSGVGLPQLPIDSAAANRLGGSASGAFHLQTAGVGRDELLQKLSATGQIHLSDLQFSGWDVNASVADGEARPGISHWASGDGAFTIRDRSVLLDDVRLDGGAQFTLINGTVSFARDANLAVETVSGRRAVHNPPAPGHILKIVGPLDGPRVTEEKSARSQPAD